MLKEIPAKKLKLVAGAYYSAEEVMEMYLEAYGLGCDDGVAWEKRRAAEDAERADSPDCETPTPPLK